MTVTAGGSDTRAVAADEAAGDAAVCCARKKPNLTADSELTYYFIVLGPIDGGRLRDAEYAS